jgi:hypothetical protein
VKQPLAVQSAVVPHSSLEVWQNQLTGVPQPLGTYDRAQSWWGPQSESRRQSEGTQAAALPMGTAWPRLRAPQSQVVSPGQSASVMQSA